VQQRPAGGQRIGGGAGGRGDDQAVGALAGDEVAVDLDPQFDHAGGGAAVDHHVVHGQRLEHALAVAHHAGVHQRALVFLVLAGQHGRQHGAVLVQRDVGDEAQPALVDADQGHAVAGQLAADAQHGAVAAHHQAQVAVRADGGDIQHRGVAGHARVAGGVAFHHHLAALGRQELRNVLQRGAVEAATRRRHRGVVLADQRDLPEDGFHRQITSLKFRRGLRTMKLDDRAKLLLKALIERYIAEGQPVGSRTLSRASGLELSPATIRNVMSDLEELGLVASPHTSAGRIPTARGYRLCSSTPCSRPSATTSPLRPAARPAAEGDRQRRADAVQPVAVRRRGGGAAPQLRVPPHRIPAAVGAALPGHHRVARRRRAEPGGVHTPADYTQSQLAEAANYLNAHYAGLAIEQVRERLKTEVEQLRGEIVVLMQTAVDASSEAMTAGPGGGGDLRRAQPAGRERLLQRHDAPAPAFELFEQKTQLMRLLDISSQAEGVRIFIGGESQVVPFEELSVVSAPYEVDGQVVGTLGVIGPTRMAYDRMIQIVDITSRLVSNALSHHKGPRRERRP
jgi:heat-inducible transcriptional repressor